MLTVIALLLVCLVSVGLAVNGGLNRVASAIEAQNIHYGITKDIKNEGGKVDGEQH